MLWSLEEKYPFLQWVAQRFHIGGFEVEFQWVNTYLGEWEIPNGWKTKWRNEMRKCGHVLRLLLGKGRAVWYEEMKLERCSRAGKWVELCFPCQRVEPCLVSSKSHWRLPCPTCFVRLLAAMVSWMGDSLRC